MNLTPEWNPEVFLRSPLFASLHPQLARISSNGFPTLGDLNALLDARQSPITVQNDLPLSFVEQVYGKLSFEMQYEPRCYLKGEVYTRSDNWHDLFNALVWLAFPKAKAAINARHYHSLTESSGALDKARSRSRDMLTLLDESGVLVVCCDAELGELLRDFQWQDLFWRRRERAKADMEFCIFGHGLYEKVMHPYIGLTGQGLILTVEREFFTWPATRRLSHLDGLVAAYVLSPQNCMNPRELNPVPLLGIPGWAAENEHLSYYHNTAYFRSGRKLTQRNQNV